MKILSHEKKSHEEVNLINIQHAKRIAGDIYELLSNYKLFAIDLYYHPGKIELQINLIPPEWKGYPHDLWFRYFITEEQLKDCEAQLIINKIHSNVIKLKRNYERDKE